MDSIFTEVACEVSLTNATDAHVLLHLNSGAVSFRAALSIRHPRDEDVYDGHKTFTWHGIESHPAPLPIAMVIAVADDVVFISTLLFTHE
jgi:hypothetical protein